MIEISHPEAMQQEPLVSVLMLAYRHEPYISEAIEGVLAQTCNFPIELIIAEDCSPDRTRAIAEEYLARRPSVIRIITGESNVGMTPNFYRALDNCRGQYIAFCEGDDYWIDEAKLRLQIEALKAHPECDISFHSDYYQYLASGKRAGPMRRVASHNRIIGVRNVLAGGGAYMPSASLVMRTDVARSLPDWARNDSGVLDVYLQAYGARRGGAYYIDRPMAVYRIGDPASWNSVVAANPDKEIAFRKLRVDQVLAMASDFPAYRSVLLDTVAGETLGVYSRAVQAGIPRLRSLSDRLLDELLPQLSLGMRCRIALARSRTIGAHWSAAERLAQTNIGRFRKLLVIAGVR